MESKLNMVPEKLERVTSAIDDSKSEYEQLLKLMPIYTIVSDLFSDSLIAALVHLIVCQLLYIFDVT